VREWGRFLCIFICIIKDHCISPGRIAVITVFHNTASTPPFCYDVVIRTWYKEMPCRMWHFSTLKIFIALASCF
jgi:hypothetical protein